MILLQPGTYRIKQGYVVVGQPGTQAAPVVVRAPRLGSVILESEMPEAIKVAAPHWRFENLVLRGVCADDTTCDNGFHVVGAARGTVLVSGLDLLVHQAVLQVELMTGVAGPLHVMREAGERALRQRAGESPPDASTGR